jgi:putative peptide zinc metalloprotease protein
VGAPGLVVLDALTMAVFSRPFRVRPASRQADATLFSASWHRVQALRPQLRGHVEHKLQIQRGAPFHVLRDRNSDSVVRLNAAAYGFVGRCDGDATVQQIWDAMVAARPQDALSQPEVIELLVGLHRRALVQFDVTPDVEALFHAQDKRRRQRRAGGVNPLAFRVALGNPAALLHALRHLGPLLFSRIGFVLWLLGIATAAVAAAMHWDALVLHGQRMLGAPGYLLLAWVCYPIIKAVHELAHGLALQSYGGQVRQAGITLVMLSPVPFVDASAADALPDRRQRALVSAAGIMAELALAALALCVWLLVQPGVVRDVAFIVLLTGSVSTLLTNGNPLLRYDGYFVLCDLMDLRNLASRSGRWWREGLGRVLFGVPSLNPVEPLPGERGWLLAYAPLSWVYRLGLSVLIGLWVGHYSAPLGALVGALLLATTVALPLWTALKALQLGTLHDAQRGRALARIAIVTVLLVAILGWLPVPSNTVAQGVVWLPERAQIRAGTDGFIVRLHAQDGQQVQAGALIAELEDLPLVARRASLAGDIAEADVRLFHAIDQAPQDAPDQREKLAYSQAELDRVDERLRLREVRAQADGTLVLPRAQDLLGQFRQRGEPLGHLLTSAPQVVRVALPQQQADLVRERQGPVRVRLADDPATEHVARITQQVPGTVAQLPSAALGDLAGGDIATDPTDTKGLTPRQPVVVMDVELATPAGERYGARATVRFAHGHAPIATQALRSLRQLVLGHFDPAG